MGLHEIMAYLPKLSEKELQELQLEVDRLSGGYVHHGVSDAQWAKVKETAAMLKAGTMKTRPGREVVAELLKRYL